MTYMDKEQADAIRYRHATRGATPRRAPVAKRREGLTLTPEARAQFRAILAVRDASDRARVAYDAARGLAGQTFPGQERVNIALLASALTRRAEAWALEHPEEAIDQNPGVRAIRATYSAVTPNYRKADAS